MKKVAILQSNYIPWKGYFDLINSVDEFIIYDQMQYTKNDWRNRNKIKKPNGLHWLTIPVKQVSLSQRIDETKVVDNKWIASHLLTIKQFYLKAAHYKESIGVVEELYNSCNFSLLSDINFHFMKGICDFLEIKTKLSWSHEYGLIEGKTERLVDLVLKAGGTEYLSGPSAKDYIKEDLFKEAGIKLTWMDYSNYPEYNQLHEPFVHAVSIIDTILNVGGNSKNYMKSFNNHE
jgi:hypothetical protein